MKFTKRRVLRPLLYAYVRAFSMRRPLGSTETRGVRTCARERRRSTAHRRADFILDYMQH